VFRVEPNGPDRIDIEINGQIDADEMRAALDELLEKSSGIEHGVMLYRIDNFKLPTLGALGVEFVRLPELFRLVGRFDRVAVLSREEWVKKAGELEGAFIPGLTIKAFDPEESDEAQAWLIA